MAQQDDLVIGMPITWKPLRQLPHSTIPNILQRLKSLERKSFAAKEGFVFDDRVVRQRNMEILVGFHGQSTSSSVIAYAVWVTSNRRLLLHKICVSPSFRRKRIGSSLMETLIGDAKHRSCRTIDLWVDEANDAARGLYSKHGFIVQESVQDYYSPGRNGVKMVLNLKDDIKPLLAFSLVSSLVSAAPQLAFPINSQVPPVAYASQPYSFIFAATTFVSSAPQISYAITDGPTWLELDSTSREFTGTPEAQDIGATTLYLTASDLTGQISTSVTFVVAASSELSTTIDILPQLGRSGMVSAPNSLLLHPQEAFDLSIQEDTFIGVSTGTRFYAVSADNTPLPSWVQFDTTRDTAQLLFSGTTPVLISPFGGAQTYQLRLIASNVPGFAESTIDFNLVITQHVLGFSEASQNIVVRPGVRFESPSLRPLLTLDGRTVADNQIANVDANAPTGVEFDRHRLSLNGTVDTAINATVTISVTDIYGDIANAIIFLKSTDHRNASLGTIATINLTAGEYFSYNVVTPSFSPAIRAIPDLSNATSWVNFNSVSWTLSGVVPLDQSSQTVDIPITFENATSTSTGEVILQVLRKTEAPAFTSTHISKTYTLPLASATSMAPEPTMSPRGRHTGNEHLLHIVLATVFSVVGTCLILLLIVCYLRKRKRTRKVTSKNSAKDNPGPVEDHATTEPPEPGTLSLEMLGVAASPTTAPPRPPRPEFAWSSDSLRHSRRSLSGTVRPGPLSYHRTSQTFTVNLDLSSQAEATAAREGASDTVFAPTDVRGGKLQHPASVRINRSPTMIQQSHNRSSSRMSRRSVLPPTVGLPDRRSGAGHGAGILLGGPADGASSRMSWRNSWTSNPSTDPRRTTVVLESFPAPPRDGPDLVGAPSRAKTPIPLLRVVSEDSEKGLSVGEQLQRWHTERARARLEGASRFSNAGSARVMPSPHTAWRVRSDMRTETRAATVSMSKTYANGPSREQSWFQWSGVGPAAREASQAGSPSRSVIDGPTLRSHPSAASSGQFESVTSSDSQWEDEENLAVEETEQGVRQWQTDKGSQVSPRLPFSSVPKARDNMSNRSASDRASQQTRVVEKRKHVSVEDGRLKRSYGSQRGSLRFI